MSLYDARNTKDADVKGVRTTLLKYSLSIIDNEETYITSKIYLTQALARSGWLGNWVNDVELAKSPPLSFGSVPGYRKLYQPQSCSRRE